MPQLATTDLTGWTVAESASRGKHLLLRLGDPATASATPCTRTCGWTAPGGRTPRASAGPAGPAHLIRVVLRTAAAVAVGYHLHELALVPTADEERTRRPPRPGPARRRLGRRPRRSGGSPPEPDDRIAEALLDQRNLAGVGNLYKAETLFLRGLWPWTPVAEVPGPAGAWSSWRSKLVASNRGRWTQTTTGSLRRGETSYVYGRRAQPCRRCGTAIRKAEQDERVTYWCPRCQPEPATRRRLGGGQLGRRSLGEALGDGSRRRSVASEQARGRRGAGCRSTGWPSSAT